MTFLNAFQIIFDIFAGFGIAVLLLKLARSPKDDPRLSRGLQILQSKIAILEDLSDRTENQVRGLMALLDQKNIEVQTRIDRAGEQIRLVEESIRSSMDVAKIFQDKIPHQEIIERKNTLKYLQAARLANQGQSPEQILQVLDLPLGEIEFIAKVNREQLSFSMDELPAWAKAELAQFDQARQQLSSPPQLTKPQEMPERSVEQESPKPLFSSDLNFLGHSEDDSHSKGPYQPSSEISPLAMLSNEPHFQAFESFKYQVEASQRPETTTTPATPAPRELTAQDNRHLTTLKRTQSLIANLDRQFSLSLHRMEEEPAPLPRESAPLPRESAPPQREAAPTSRELAPPEREVAPLEREVAPTLREAALTSRNFDLPKLVHESTRQVSNRSQGSATYEVGSIRKVVFPTVQATRANLRKLER